MAPILSASDRSKLLDAYERRWQILEVYDPDIEENTRLLAVAGYGVAKMVAVQEFYASVLVDFLKSVVSWKMPHRKADVVGMVSVNSDREIISAFGRLRDPSLNEQVGPVDRANVEAITTLRGFQVRMASAVLRHLWPSFYGVLDWRNWALLSNSEGYYLEKPLLDKLANTLKELREAHDLFTVERYIQYLDVLRRAGKDLFGTEAKPSEVDLAIWALSWVHIPSHYGISQARQIRAELEKGFRRPQSTQLRYFEEIWKSQQRYMKSLCGAEDRYWAWHDLLAEAEQAIPDDFYKWDEAAQMRGSYSKFFHRDVMDLKRRLSTYALERGADEMSKFFFDHMLKGKRLGVIR